MEVTEITQRHYILIFSKHFLISQKKNSKTNPKPNQKKNLKHLFKDC